MYLPASLYSLGSVLIGGVLIADNLAALSRGGDLRTNPEGKAMGWSFFFMVAEVCWLAASLFVLWTRFATPLLPGMYLLYAFLVMGCGFVFNIAQSSPVRSFPVWFVSATLVFSVAFTIVALYESFNLWGIELSLR
jgi:hypothetical protein